MRRLTPIAIAAVVLFAFSGCSKDPEPTPPPDAANVEQPGPDASVACDFPCGTTCCTSASEVCIEATSTCCTPSCQGKACGPDGCGGECAPGCAQNEKCVAGACERCPYLACGNVCCQRGEHCDPVTHQCAVCTPDCEGKQCGDNGCGGKCPPGCDMAGQICDEETYQCVGCHAPDGGVLFPDCNGWTLQCGPDPVTGCSCGNCASDESCVNGTCKYCPTALCFGVCCLETEYCDFNSLTCKPCMPQCEGKVCGPDGCGGQCGTCPPDNKCDVASGTCSACTADCGTRKCGPDKDGCVCPEVCTGNDSCVQGLCEPCSRPLCGGVCCPPGSQCDTATNRCVRCDSQCAGKQCGDDGCGGLCGVCQPGTRCVNGTCQPCQPDCAGKQCGDDGCGGTCGGAQPCDPQQGLVCIDHQCVACPYPEQVSDVCARLQAQCGDVYVVDYCSLSGKIDCGDPAQVCTAPTTYCDPATSQCVEPCAPETDAELCSRTQRECGQATGADNCGQPRFVQSCGTCAGTVCSGGRCL